MSDTREFLFRLYWLAKWEQNTQVVWNGGPHYHQAHMARVALNGYVDTPNILFLEHDTPLVTDEPVDFTACEALIEQRAVDVLRFHHEAGIIPEHEHLMIDHQTISMMDVGCAALASGPSAPTSHRPTTTGRC